MIAEIAFPVPLRRTFYYRVKAEMLGAARPGLRVLASFGPRKIVGMIMKLHEDSSVDLSGFRESKIADIQAFTFQGKLPFIFFFRNPQMNFSNQRPFFKGQNPFF